MRFKNYINRYNKKNRIYSEEELLAMTLNDLLDNEPSILAQDGDIGIPSYEELRQSPNTRWVDSYINSQGQKDGGFFGSIPEYDESFFPKKKIEPFVFNPNPPYMMSMLEGEPEAEQEESPIVLEGGVEENVYLPEEDEEQEPEPSVYIPDEEEPEERQKTPYELSDEDLIDILQSIIKSRTSSSIEQEEPLFDDSFPTIHQTNTPYTPPVSLPQIQTSLNQEELKQMYEKLLEELRKMLRASNVYKNGTYIGGASQISTNNLDNIFSEKMNNANNILPQELKSALKNLDKKNSDVIYENLLVNPIDLPKYRKQKELEKTAQKVEFVRPVEGKILSDFGYRPAPVAGASSNHLGIDIGVPIGTPVKAIADGTVVAANGGMKGYGNGVFVDHGMINGKHVVSEYGHLSSFEVKVGAKIKQGQVIAKSGNTGTSSGPHLHITIKENKVPVDPKKYLGKFSN